MHLQLSDYRFQKLGMILLAIRVAVDPLTAVSAAVIEKKGALNVVISSRTKCPPRNGSYMIFRRQTLQKTETRDRES